MTCSSQRKGIRNFRWWDSSLSAQYFWSSLSFQTEILKPFFLLSTFYLMHNGARDARQSLSKISLVCFFFFLCYFSVFKPFLLIVAYLVNFCLLSFRTAWSILCMLCIYITLFLSLIMFLAFRVINNGKVSRRVFIELLHFLLDSNYFILLALCYYFLWLSPRLYKLLV